MRLKTTLDQWATLFEVDRSGSIHAAAIELNKSHTTLIYAIKKLERQLGISLVMVVGRKAVLTDEGKALIRRAQSVLEQAEALEEVSQQLSQEMESEIVIAIDHLCDRERLYEPLMAFFAENSTTSVQVIETSLSKTTSMVTEEIADISIIVLPITNYPSEAFGMVRMLPVVAKRHPLATKSDIYLSDLNVHRQIVLRDLGDTESRDVGWLKSNQRITVDNFDHAWQAVKQGLGFCRFPEHIIKRHDDESMHVLNIKHSSSYQVPLHVTMPKGEKAGKATKVLYDIMLASSNE